MTAQLSVGQVLSLAPDRRAQFVKQNLSREDDTLNIENITGWDDLSKAELDLLAQQLLLAVQKATTPSVDAGQLAALLAQIPSDRGSPLRDTTANHPNLSRSPTAEPPEGELQEYEARCYQALLEDGCRPLFHISLLAQVETNPDAFHDLLRPWTRYPDTSDPEDWQVFSRQRDRWKQFRTWQLCNRRQTVSFSEYLDEDRRDFVMRGGNPERTARPDFEQAARRRWEREYDHVQSKLNGNDDDDNVPEAFFSRYAEAVKTLLMDHGLVLPFQLHQDPKQQDQRTTYVEYLAFECSYLGGLVTAAQKLQQPPSHTQRCQIAKAKADHQQIRVDWVRSEIGKIEAEHKVAAKSGSSVGIRGRKRKQTDDGHVEPPLGKRRRTDEMEKMAASRSDKPRITRGKKCKPPADADPLETRKAAGESDGPGIRSRQRRERIHEKNGSADPSSVLQLGRGAVAVPAVTTFSRTRREPEHERVRTLRPRVDGKVASAHGLKTRGGEAARKPRGRRRSAGSISKVT